MQKGFGHPGKLPRSFEQFKRVNLEFHEPLDGLYGVPKDKPISFKGAEDISGHGKVAAFYIGKEQGGASSLEYTPLYSPNLQVGVNLLGNAKKFSSGL